MKILINMAGFNSPVYAATTPDVINRKALAKALGIDNTELCRLEKRFSFEMAIKLLLEKKKKRSMM